MKEIDQLRGFLLTVFEYLELPISDEAMQPILHGNSITGFRQAVTDAVEFHEDLKPSQIRELDLLLSEQGLPTLSAMSEKKFRSLLTILGRGQIRSESEYYIVKSYVVDVDSIVISDDNRRLGEQLIVDYEGMQS